VSALQKVSSTVWVDFAQQATLYWLASVLQSSLLSPNQMGYPYTQNSDAFALQITNDMRFIHDADGWEVPDYDSREYTVNVGFGLRIREWVYWGFSVLCSPGCRVHIDAGSYQFVRSNGGEQMGDPIAEDRRQWDMPIGFSYRLAFDASGNGTLTTLDE
jgi:hypothetical protein